MPDVRLAGARGLRKSNHGRAEAADLGRTEIVQLESRQAWVTLTGDVQARVRAELSFRVSGRVTERLVDVGAHVDAGDVLARVDPTEQQADLDAAAAAVAAAESQVRVTQATFDRQKALLANGFTTRASYDQAQEALRTAEGSLDAAKAQLGTAKDAVTYTELRASAAGIITARNLEVGQVAQAAQSAFTLAQDGDRDAVFDVYELIFFSSRRATRLRSAAVGPGRDGAGACPRSFADHRSEDRDGAGEGRHRAIPRRHDARQRRDRDGNMEPVQRIVLPWSALAAVGAAPAVWVVDGKTMTVSLRRLSSRAMKPGRSSSRAASSRATASSPKAASCSAPARP